MKIDNFTSYDAGLMFAHAFRTLFEKHMQSRNTIDYKDFSLIIPAMVNGTLACELFIKSLYPSAVHGHKIKELLLNLENVDKATYDLIVSHCIATLNLLEQNKNYDKNSFIDELEIISNAFVELRYFYEPNSQNKAYNLQLIGVFVGTLESICERKFGSRPKNTN